MNFAIINLATQDTISTGSIKGDALKDPFSYIHQLQALQADEDILHLGKLGMADFGIDRLHYHRQMISSMDPSTLVSASPSSLELRSRSEDKEPHNTKNVMLDGSDTGLKVGVIMYNPGWILGTGVSGYNLYGIRYSAYLKGIGSKRLHYVSDLSAKVFSSLKSVKQYIDKYDRTFRYMVSKNGYAWSLEPSCEMFLKDYESSLNPAGLAKYTAEKEEITELLDLINQSSSETAESESSLPSVATPEAIREEALSRMGKYGLTSTCRLAYKRNGKIFQSMSGGILYDLDDDAKVAVQQVTDDYGLTPYHVVLNEYEGIGKIYTVLYVSNDPHAWNEERSDRDNYCCAYCWNVDQQFGEFGTVQVVGANGGLIRIG